MTGAPDDASNAKAMSASTGRRTGKKAKTIAISKMRLARDCVQGLNSNRDGDCVRSASSWRFSLAGAPNPATVLREVSFSERNVICHFLFDSIRRLFIVLSGRYRLFAVRQMVSQMIGMRLDGPRRTQVCEECRSCLIRSEPSRRFIKGQSYQGFMNRKRSRSSAALKDARTRM